MHHKKDWNPDLYLKFERERTQPSRDLAGRIELDVPKAIADIGCGPGNSTQVLRKRWPESRIIGMDNSPAMIEKAKADYPDGEWLLCDAADLEPGECYDLIFANAVLQWLPDHNSLLPSLLKRLRKGGALAVQVPMYTSMPVRAVVRKAGQDSRWAAGTAGCMDSLSFHAPDFYFDLLSGRVRHLELWKTDYIHIMNSHRDILEMIRAAGLKPYLERIESNQDRNEFELLVLEGIEQAYPACSNGKVLFPFERLFFIAYV